MRPAAQAALAGIMVVATGSLGLFCFSTDRYNLAVINAGLCGMNIILLIWNIRMAS